MPDTSTELSPDPHRNQRLLAGFVYGVALVVILWKVGVHTVLQSTLSPWNDELASVYYFASKGWLHVLTDYHIPNNHIFFNFLNSLLPELSYDPLRMRILSFIAVWTGLLGSIVYCVYRKLWLTGCIIPFVFAASTELLTLSLNARGYGICWAFFTGLLLCGHEYFLSNRGKILIPAVILAWLGTWTVPTFAFLALPFFTLVFLWKRNRYPLIALIVYGALCFFSYLPVADDVFSEAASYSGEWGRSFASLQGVKNLFLMYGLFEGQLNCWLLLIASATLTGAAGYFMAKSPAAKMATVTLGAFAGAIGICLIMQTPALRSVCFYTVVPLYAAALAGDALARQLNQRHQGLAILAVSSLLATILASYGYRSAHRIALENYVGVAKTLQLVNLHQQDVFISFRPHWIAPYYPDNLTKNFSINRFREGNLLLVENSFLSIDRVNPRALDRDAIVIVVPQRNSGPQLVSLVPNGDHTSVPTIALRYSEPANSVELTYPEHAYLFLNFDQLIERNHLQIFRQNSPGNLQKIDDQKIAIEGSLVRISPVGTSEKSTTIHITLNGGFPATAWFTVPPSQNDVIPPQ